MGNRVGFVGWMVVGGRMCFFFAHFDFRVDRRPELREVKPRSARNKEIQAAAHSEIV